MESFIYARVDVFLCAYLGAPLCDKVCGLVVKVSVVLYFYGVVWCEYCVNRGRVGVPYVCGSSFPDRTSFLADMRGDGLIC